MTSKISTKQRKYLTKPPQVTHIAQEMKSEWESAASLQVYQLEAVKWRIRWRENVSSDYASNILVYLWLMSGFVLSLSPFMAVFRKVKEYTSYAQVLESVHIANFYKYTSLQNLYHPHSIPVITDTIKYDGKTKPPIRGKRGAGRPKVKRYRRRSELLDASQSRIKCSLCGTRGHNCRTCSAPKTGALEQLSL